MASLTLILADSHAILRSGVRALLEHDQELEIVEAADLDDLVDQALQAQRPTIALIDLDLPPRGAAAAVSNLRDFDIAAVVWSHALRLTPTVVYDLVRTGAVGVLHNDISPAGLARSLRAIVGGEAALSRDLTTRLVARIQSLPARSATGSAVSALSKRELEVLALVADGRSNRAIASELGISEFTVKRHVQSVLNKLSLHSRREAATRYRAAREELATTTDAAAMDVRG